MGKTGEEFKLSKINAAFKQAFNFTPLLGKLQQHGLVKIVFDPWIDGVSLVQLTKKCKQQLTELFFSTSLIRNLNIKW